MAHCYASEINKNINTSSSTQSSDVPSFQEVKTEEVMEPLMLEDFRRSSIPTTLIELMKFFEGKGLKPSKSEFLIGCLHILMLEYGFVPFPVTTECITSYEFNWKEIHKLVSVIAWNKLDDVTYDLTFVLTPYIQYVSKLVCLKIGDDLIINASVKNLDNTSIITTCTMMLNISSYYTDSINSVEDLKKLQNLREMSVSFKDQIAFPIRHSVFHEVRQKQACLDGLPVEVIHYMFKFMHGRDISRLTTTCSYFYAIRQDHKLWQDLLLRDFQMTNKNEDYKPLMKKYLWLLSYSE